MWSALRRFGVAASFLLPLAFGQSPGATVTITTKLGVVTTFVAKNPDSSAPRPVNRLLERFKDGDDPGVLLEWTRSTYLIVPLGAVKSAVVEGGRTRVSTSIGDFTARLASKLRTTDGREYDLSTAVKLDVSHPGSKRADGKDPALKPGKPAWRLTLPARPERTFDLESVEVRFGFYTTVGYIQGGEDSFYDSGVQVFKLRVDGEDIPTQLSDFPEIEFFHAAGKLMAKVKAPNGQVTTGEFVVTRTDSKGEHPGHTRFLVGRLLQANACFVLVGENEPAWKITQIRE